MFPTIEGGIEILHRVIPDAQIHVSYCVSPIRSQFHWLATASIVEVAHTVHSGASGRRDHAPLGTEVDGRGTRISTVDLAPSRCGTEKAYMYLGAQSQRPFAGEDERRNQCNSSVVF